MIPVTIAIFGTRFQASLDYMKVTRGEGWLKLVIILDKNKKDKKQIK